MNVRDTHLPLLKSMTVQYKRRAQGGLLAVASLTPEQVELIQSADKGEVDIQVLVTDERDNAAESPPIECEMIWAWVPKPTKSKL